MCATKRPVPARALDAALRLLTQRALSHAELEIRLKRRGYDNEAITAAVQTVQGYGYINDAGLAQQTAAAAAQRGRGALWVAQKLRRRGIAQSTAEQAAAQAYPSERAAVDTARALLNRKFRTGWSDQRQKARAYRFLCGRGFNPNIARHAIDEAEIDV